MPLIRDEDGEPIGARCINDCGDLARLDQRAAFVVPPGSASQEMTVLICPVCNYCEWYYGVEEDEEDEEEGAEGASPPGGPVG